jgi:hypothetical protein
MLRVKLDNRLLKKLDIALQTAGAPLHRLFDGADFDARDILRTGYRRAEQATSRNAKAESQPAGHPNPRFKTCCAVNLSRVGIPLAEATTLRPQSRVVLYRPMQTIVRRN